MKKILGLDIGTTSIGWGLIDEDGHKILGMGSRIVPLSTDDRDEFSKGNTISKNQNRTLKRTQRKGYDRYQLRRKNLIAILKQFNMLPGQDLIILPKLDLWEIRSKAINEKLSLQEIGRVLLHLNQKRGYKSSRNEANLDKKDTEYVAEVKSRYEKLKDSGFSIGQHFYNELLKDKYYRIKEQVFPREAYVEEYNLILAKQQSFYPIILTNDLINKIGDEIIYYQRKLKSQKSLVSICDFEGFWIKKNINGKERDLFVGPKVAHKSSPLFQVSKIWEIINNITIKQKKGGLLDIQLDKKRQIFEYLDNNEKMTFSELLKILELKKDDVYGNKQLVKGLPGNKTKLEIKNCFDDFEKYKDLFLFDIPIIESEDETSLIDKRTGEIISTKYKKQIKSDIETQPLYMLWHTIYSIADKKECQDTLIKKYNLSVTIASKLASIDFTKQGFGNKSHKAIRKILPYLIEGDVYSDACSYAGYNHSNSLTKQENFERKLLDKLKPIEKNSLRQPVVEKILNQMVNLVNALIDKYGRPEEVRVELARELKQGKEERNETFININANENINKEIINRLTEMGINPTRKTIEKYKFIFPIRSVINKDGRVDSPKLKNAVVFNQCIYCGQSFGLSEALYGNDFDVDHIIPQTLLFDDSNSNKVLVHRKCNSAKLNKTAYDYIRTKGEEELNNYLERINNWYDKGIISYSKLEKLKASHEDYLERKNRKKETASEIRLWENFIDRQLKQTQYISKKAIEIIQSICHNVWVTSGNVTAELRHIWGWDDVVMNLNLPKYREIGLTEFIEISNDENKYKKEIIKGWSKRDDHRHHAIDALTIACTKQGFIQRFNNLNSIRVRDEMKREIDNSRYKYDKRKNLLENYIFSNKPFTTEEVEREAEKILVSFKAGKKVASRGNRKIKKDGKKVIVQSNIIIPRGPLSEESVYGKIKTIDKEKSLKYLFENPNLIFKNYIKLLVEERLSLFEGDLKKAIASLKKEPIYLDSEKKKILKYGTCYKAEYVIKYPLSSITAKDVSSIVDNKVRGIVNERLLKYNNKEKEAFKDLENNPLWYNEEKKIPIKTVRLFTGLSAVESVKKDMSGNDIGFVKPGNNHHLAVYLDEFGNKHLSICSFWHAVERKKYGLPVVIKDPLKVVDMILEEEEDKYPDSFIEKLPDGKWTFIESFQQNEMFILGLIKEDYVKAISDGNNGFLSNYLYRVQKIFFNGKQLEIYFRHHLETQLIDNTAAKMIKRFYQVQSLAALDSLLPKKVIINCLGEVKVKHKMN
ncbi:MAG: type II CRISPR RNA-guided endonuclease Cas9 [Ignavibacteriaceae bacterium]